MWQQYSGLLVTTALITMLLKTGLGVSWRIALAAGVILFSLMSYFGIFSL